MSDEFAPSIIDLAAGAVQLIRTSLRNPRVLLDKNGLRAYDANGNLIIDIDAVTGEISTFTAGVDAHGFDFYDDTYGFHYRLSSTRPAMSFPVWGVVSPTWGQVKALGLTWGQMKARAKNGSWNAARLAVRT